jgi:hypothetical protein
VLQLQPFLRNVIDQQLLRAVREELARPIPLEVHERVKTTHVMNSQPMDFRDNELLGEAVLVISARGQEEFEHSLVGDPQNFQHWRGHFTCVTLFFSTKVNSKEENNRTNPTQLFRRSHDDNDSRGLGRTGGI